MPNHKVPQEVIEAAQVLGAKLRKDFFYTEHDVLRGINCGSIAYTKDAFGKKFTVQVDEAGIVDTITVPWLKENTLIDRNGVAVYRPNTESTT